MLSNRLATHGHLKQSKTSVATCVATSQRLAPQQTRKNGNAEATVTSAQYSPQILQKNSLRTTHSLRMSQASTRCTDEVLRSNPCHKTQLRLTDHSAATAELFLTVCWHWLKHPPAPPGEPTNPQRNEFFPREILQRKKPENLVKNATQKQNKPTRKNYTTERNRKEDVRHPEQKLWFSSFLH